MEIKLKKVSSAKAKNKLKDYFLLALRLLILTAIGYLVLFPLLYIITNAVKTADAMRNPLVVWFSTSMTFENFKYAFKALEFKTSILNTLLFEIVSALLEVGSCAVAAYGLSRFKFKGKKILLVFLILMIIVPEQMVVLSSTVNYSNFSFLGLVPLINKAFGTQINVNILNTVLPFWMPSLFGVGLKSGILIYIYMQFFKGLPYELEEAAWIDGAGPYRTFISIAIPSSSVVIFTVFIFSVIWHWNDYSYAVMYLTGRFTTAVTLSNISQGLTLLGFWGSPKANAIILAACLIFIAPVLLMYIFCQKKFIKSIDRVGITG